MTVKAFLAVLGFLVIFAVSCGAGVPSATPTSVPAQATATQAPQGTGAQTGSAVNVVQPPADIRGAGPNRVEYIDPIPMVQRIKVQKGPVDTSNGINVPVITWGGDVQAVHANGDARTTQPGSTFAQKGLKINLFREDNFDRQVEKVISGYTPYLRGTVGMENCALETLEARGIKMLAVYQLTYSTGGDTFVVRDDVVKKPEDLRGRTVVLQRCGPHAEYLAKILQDASLKPTDVAIKWTRELTLPPYDSKGVAVDPFSAMQRDDSVAAAMMISPDMLVATAGGNIGVGGESTKNAKMLLSTRTAGRVIADLFWVREDYYQAHPQDVQNFVHGMLVASEEVTSLYNNKQSGDSRYQVMLKASAEILRDSAQATGDIEGLLGDAEFAGHAGNIQFFTGVGTTRTYDALHREVEGALIAFGLRSVPIPPQKVSWDYQALAAGLKNPSAQIPAVPTPRFDQAKVEQFASTRQTTGAASALFNFSIGFEANQDEFSAEQYSAAFSQAIDWADTYSGAIIIVTGYADTYLYNQQKVQYKDHAQRTTILGQLEQAAKNTSQQRAQRVKESILNLARERGVFLDPTQITAHGAGYSNVLYPNPQPESTTQCTQCAANRRVVFELIPIEAEAVQFGGK